jgi:hypothetical protein
VGAVHLSPPPAPPPCRRMPTPTPMRPSDLATKRCCRDLSRAAAWPGLLPALWPQAGAGLSASSPPCCFFSWL